MLNVKLNHLLYGLLYRLTISPWLFRNGTGLRLVLGLWCGLGSAVVQGQVNPYFPPGQVPVIVATPAPPWAPGTTVTFSVTINNFDFGANSGAQWFSGISFLYDPACWLNFNPGPPPVSYSNGVWLYTNPQNFPNQCGLKPWQAACANQPGFLLPTQGWYIDNNQNTNPPGIGIDGVPCNNFGDTPTAGPWNFTWSATVPTPLPAGCNQSMGIRVWGDGEVGTYGGQLPGNPCQNITIDYEYVKLTACVDENFTIPKVTGVPNSAIVQATWNDATVVSGSGPGPYVVKWSTPSTPTQQKNIVLKFFDLLTNQLIKTVEYQVEVFLKPTSDFSVSNFYPSLGCDTVTVLYTGTASAEGADFDWDFDFANSGAVQIVGGDPNGEGPGPFQLVFTEPGNYVIALVEVNTGCVSDSNQVFIQVAERPGTKFTTSRSTLCANDTLTVRFTDTDTSGVYYQWDFDGAFPQPGSGTGTASGLGPFTLSWTTPGVKKIRLDVLYPACSKSRELEVTVTEQPLASGGNSQFVCADAGPVTLTGTVQRTNPVGSCTYEWREWPSGVVVGTQPGVTVNPPSGEAFYVFTATCAGCVSRPDTVRVVRRPAVFASVDTPEVLLCAGSGGVVLPAHVSGGTPGYTYRWEPSLGLNSASVEQPVALPTATTVYTLTAFDSLGCSAPPVTVQVTVVPRPLADAGADVVLCAGDLTPPVLNGSVQNPVPGHVYGFLWQPSTGLSDSTAQNPLVIGQQSAFYTLIVRDETAGCVSAVTDTARVAVLYRPSPDVALPAQVSLCLGQTLTIGEAATGAGPDYTYLWSTGETTALIEVSPTDTTIYTVVATSNGCSSPPRSVVVNTIPVPVVAFSRPQVTVCPGQRVRLEPEPTGLTPTSQPVRYTWTPATGLSDPNIDSPWASPAATTVYTLTVAYVGCAVSATVEVQVPTLPVVDADPTGQNSYSLCLSDTTARIPLNGVVTGLAPGTYDVRWTPESAVEDPTALVTTARPTESQMLYLTVTLIESGCTVVDSVLVNVSPYLNISWDPEGAEICQGDSVDVTVYGTRGGAVFSWSPNENLTCYTRQCYSAKLKPTETTTYTVRVQEGACDTSFTFKVVVRVQPRADFTVSQSISCNEVAAFFEATATNAVAYRWDFGDGTTSEALAPTHLYTQAGTYDVSLVAIGPGGYCLDTLTKQGVVVVLPYPEADFTSEPAPKDNPTDTLFLTPTAIVRFFDLTQDSIVYWLWDFGDSTSAAEQNPVHTYRIPGRYEVSLVVTDIYGCVDTIRKGTYLVVEPSLKPLPNVFTPNGDGVNDVFIPSFIGPYTWKLSVYDRWGTALYAGTGGWDGKFPSGTEAPPNVYWYVLEVSNGRTYQGWVTLFR
jgi:gliding motility-associated-like protein